MCTYIELNPHDCYRELNINIGQPGSIAMALNLAKKFNFSFILLNGNSQSISQVLSDNMKRLNRMEDVFYLPFLTNLKYVPRNISTSLVSLSYEKGTALINFQGYLAINTFLYYTLDIPTVLIDELESRNPVKTVWTRILRNTQFQKILREEIKSTPFCKNTFLSSFCKRNLKLWHIEMIHEKYNTTVCKIISSMMLKQEVGKFLIDFWKRTYYIENVSERKLLNQ